MSQIIRKFEAHLQLIEADLIMECNASVNKAMTSMYVLADLAFQSGIVLDIENHIARLQSRIRPSPDLTEVIQLTTRTSSETVPHE